MLRRSMLALALLAIAAGGARAQEPVTPSLAEVARQAEAAKATAKKAKKTYTNSNLTADPRGEAAPAAAPAPATGFVSKSLGKAVPPEELVSRSEAKVESDVAVKESEETWRGRAASLRRQVDQLRARLAELSTPNALRDTNPALKAAADTEIKNTRTGLDGLRKQWARLELSAREIKVPMAWIQPEPTFPQ